ncbi:MAG: DsbE family thiol:disulfide interchange protein [Thiotrichales bacterium]
MKLRFLIPLIIFLGISAFLYMGLSLDPREVPSPLIGKPAPTFALPSLHDTSKTITPADYKGQIWLMNVWATWCASCRAEHATLVRLSRETDIPIVGLNYKDNDDDARKWLIALGDPYASVAVDANGRIAIDWGVYGAPETYVIDQQGLIQHKHIGPVTPEVLQEKILPLIARLREGASS